MDARVAESDEATRTADWRQLEEWDRRYYIHPFRTLEEYSHTGVERAEGSYLHLADGRRILDFMSQYICVNLGHGNVDVQMAMAEAAKRFTYLSEPWASEYRSRAAKVIMEDVLGDERWAGGLRFVSTGSEAIEMAQIIAKLYTGRSNIVTQEFSYHGWTLGAAGATGLRSSRGNIAEPGGQVKDVPGYPPAGFHLVPAPNCFRCTLAHTYPECTTKGSRGQLPCVQQAESLIRNIGPETVAAFVCDVSLGAGSIQPPPEYIPQIREMTKRLGILWIDDEVLCGFGRMGTWFGYQGYPGVTPDIMATGKGIDGSAIPAAAVVVNKDIAEFLSRQRWWLPSTMGGHPVAMAAVVASLQAMLEHKVVEGAAEMGAYLGKRLTEIARRHPSVGHVDGTGMFWVIELVKTPGSNEPFVLDDRYAMGSDNLAEWPVQVITKHCLERDVFITGFVPNTLRLGPPLTLSREECDEGLAALDFALTQLDVQVIA